MKLFLRNNARYGWRYQIGPWVRKGARVIVPDMLGYGGTDKPKDPAEYTPKKLCDDLVALLDLLQVKSAVRNLGIIQPQPFLTFKRSLLDMTGAPL